MLNEDQSAGKAHSAARSQVISLELLDRSDRERVNDNKKAFDSRRMISHNGLGFPSVELRDLSAWARSRVLLML